MTLTQLNAFVLVARLGSVTAAANALGVSESAVSQALSALRLHLGDQLVSRGPTGMTLTAGGSRLLSTASQIVVLGAEAHAAVRAAQGAPEQLRVVATSTLAEFVVSPLMEAFTRRFSGVVEVSAGVAVTNEMAVLVANRLADVAIGQAVTPDPALPVVSEPIFRYRLVVVTAGESRLKGNARQWRWLVDPAGTDPDSDTGRLLAALRIPESRIGVFPNQTAAWAAAADGTGVAPAVEHLVARYGSTAVEVLELIRADKPLGQPLAGGAPYLRAEVAYAVTHEGALHVTDVLARRVRLLIESADSGASVAPEVAAIMAPLLGWNRRRRAAEAREYQAFALTNAAALRAPAAVGDASDKELVPA